MKAEGVESHIVEWLNSYLEKAESKGFVVGISGGIDSAVTSALAARTGHPTLCVEMPIHQHSEQVERGTLHMQELREQYRNVSLAKVDLTRVFDSFVEELPAVADSDLRELSLANSRSRLRMTTLYYFAGLKRYLVTGTGNKVEDFGVGFFTKYGDGGVDISPIADLTKTEVYELGRHLGINDRILNAPPTDGLWGDDRSDEDQLGATYPELEWAMQQSEKGKREENFEGREREVFRIYMRLHRANLHKMKPVPICEIPEVLKS